jgi:pimeloyl-ACP methyl ester carboxylesterase
VSVKAGRVRFASVSTPTSLELPDGVRPVTVSTSRGSFAALRAVPVTGVCEREPALLVPGYTGSKEDFLAVLAQLADHGRQVVAIDMRGQFETPGAAEISGYSPAALAADVAALIAATGARHLLGHSYGGLVTREALLRTRSQDDIESFTLMSSGPSALTGSRAEELRLMLDSLSVPLAGAGGSLPDRSTLRSAITGIWRDYLEPRAVAEGHPAPIVAFLARRMLSNDPYGLIQMARHLLTAPDRTSELARLDRFGTLVLYGEDDNSWSPAVQEAMARRLGARRICIPGASHSPAVEAPATTAIALTQFWDAAETAAAHAASARMA